MTSRKNRPFSNAAAFLPLFLAASFAVFLLSRAAMIDKAAKNAPLLEQIQEQEISNKLDALYPERLELLRDLPYEAPAADFELQAGAAILVDYNTGFVLYQKKLGPSDSARVYDKAFFDAVGFGKSPRGKGGP